MSWLLLLVIYYYVMITIISYLLLCHDYYFSLGRLYYTWKPEDIKAATVILFNYEIF